jgi:hypothetical protein
MLEQVRALPVPELPRDPGRASRRRCGGGLPRNALLLEEIEVLERLELLGQLDGSRRHRMS